MDAKLLLAKSLTLLYRESLLSDRTDTSADLVRTVLENVKVSEVGIGLNSDREVIMALKATILEMCSMPQDHVYEKSDLLQRIKINCGNEERLFEAMKQSIDEDLPESSLKKSVVGLRRTINNHFREEKIGEVINKASTDFKFNREKIKDVNTFIDELIAQLEPLQNSIGQKDTAVIGEVDIGNEESMRNVFTNVVKMNNGERIYRLGWQDVNDMLQGGMRPGECWVHSGLQHKYKTGMNLSLFAQIALFNKPLTVDPAKKPMLLRISFEDDLTNNLQFLYQYLKFCETGERVYVKDIPVEELARYVKDKLEVNGFHIKLLRVDGSQWNYKSICNKIIELEAQGYVVEGLFLDYLYKVSRVGCGGSGIAGDDVLDIFSRVKMFCSARGTLLVTPHQLSTEAKQHLRQIPEEQFATDMVGKGYFEGTRALDRIYDGCIQHHLFKMGGKTIFHMALDKHRLPTVVEDDKRVLYAVFPQGGMPIPHDLYGPKVTYKKLKDALTGGQPQSASSEDLFVL